MNVKQNAPDSRPGNDEKNRLKRSYDNSFSPTDEDWLSQIDANEARIRTDFEARELVTISAQG